MKKVVMMIALVLPLAFNIKAESFGAFEDFLDFKEKTKDGWLKMSKELHNDKYDILIKHNNEDLEFKKEHLKKLAAELGSRAGLSEFFHKELEEMITLCRRHMRDWKEWCEKYRKKGEELAKAQEEKLNHFEKTAREYRK
jgi:hypothetical protein